LEQLKDQQYRIGIELEEHTKADHDYHIHVATVFNLCRKVKSLFEGSELLEKRAILNYLLQNPTVSGKSLIFGLRSPFNLLLDLSSSNLARPSGRFSNYKLGRRIPLSDVGVKGYAATS